MEPFGKTAGRNLVETLKYEIVSREQSETGKNVQDLDHFIRQAIGKESFLSYTRPSENPGQWVQWLETFDQKSVNKLSKGSKVEAGLDEKAGQKENVAIDCPSTDSNQMKESLQSKMKGTSAFGKGLHSPTQLMHSLKIPEAVVAFAQAAAKTNGEQDKYLPGWPLLSPKVQMLRCEKCSQEFCSSLNHRRHSRMHRRRLNMEKEDLRKERANIAAFWDKLSIDEARQVVSFNNVMLKEVPETSIIRTLSSFIQQPGLSSLPQFYLKAGTALLDVVQVKPSKFPLAAKYLFSILDDASERTFLCAGSSVSVQRLVFEGEAGNVGPEVKNLVASLGFLVEQKLVKAWIADKDAEALRCQKELVEEEEANQKKQAELLERKRLKKLRQQESREKGRRVGNPGIAVDGGSVDGADIFTELVGVNSLIPVESSTPSTRQDLSNQELSGDVSSFEVQRSEGVESKISKLLGQDFSHGSSSVNTNADQVYHCEKNTNLNVDTVSAEETGEAQNASNVRKSHTDFDLSDSHVSAAEAPLTTVSCLESKQGDGDNSIVEYNMRAVMPSDKQFVQGWRQRKKYAAVDSVYSREHPYGSDRRFSETNPQRNLKVTRKSYNGLSSGKKSLGTVIPKPLSGDMFDKHRDITVGQRVSAIANGYKMWTRKMQQISISDSSMAAESQNSKDNTADSVSVAEPDIDVHMASYLGSSGPIGKGMLVVDQYGSEFKFPEMDNSESDKNNTVPAVIMTGKNDSGDHLESVSDDDFLIGSMSVSLSNFLDGSPQQPSPEGSIITDIKHRGLLPTSQLEAPFEFAPDIIQNNEFRCNTDSQIHKSHKSSGNCFAKGCTECCKVSNGILKGNVSHNVKPGKEDGSGDIRRVMGEGAEGSLLHMTQGLSGSRIRENHDYIHTKIIETTDQFELKILLACDSASAFLSQRWKDAMSDPGAIVVSNPSSGVVQGVNDTSQ